MADSAFTILKEVMSYTQPLQFRYWVVGGFALDGKRGELTREHGDVDLCVHESDVQKFLQASHDHGYQIFQEGMKYVLRKGNFKVDVFPLFDRGATYVREREWFHATFPKVIFDKYQEGRLPGVIFCIPKNEGLRYYGSKSIHVADQAFTRALPVDERLYEDIHYEEFANYRESLRHVVPTEVPFQ